SAAKACDEGHPVTAGSHSVKLLGDNGAPAGNENGVLLSVRASLTTVMEPGATTTPTCNWLSRLPTEPVSSPMIRSWNDDPDAKCAPWPAYESDNPSQKLVFAR